MKDWEKAGLEEVVCACSNVTKGDVIEAIAEGAGTVEEVMEKTGMKCEGSSVKDCKDDVQGLLDIYLAAVQGMQCG